MNEQKIYEYISKYINGALSEQEAEQFRQRLEEDEAFRQEYELHRDLEKDLAKHQEISDLKQVIQAVTQAPTKPKKYGYWALALVGVLTLLGLAWYYFIHPTPAESGPQLYQAYYEKYPPLILRNDSDSLSLFKQGMLAYADSDYPNAIALFKQIETDKRAQFYLAMSYLENGADAKARQILDRIDPPENPELKEAIAWYQALLSLKQDSIYTAKKILSPLPFSSDSYDSMSGEILNKLKKR